MSDGTACTENVLGHLGNVEVYVHRFMVGRMVGGKLKASAFAPFRFLASVQPVTGREREFIPEGFRQKVLRKIYTAQALITHDDKALQKADILEFDKERWEVIQTEQRRGLDMNHFKSFVVRVN